MERLASPKDQRYVYGGVPPLTFAEKATSRWSRSVMFAVATACTEDAGSASAPYHAWFLASTRKSSAGKLGAGRVRARAESVTDAACERARWRCQEPAGATDHPLRSGGTLCCGCEEAGRDGVVVLVREAEVVRVSVGTEGDRPPVIVVRQVQAPLVEERTGFVECEEPGVHLTVHEPGRRDERRAVSVNRRIVRDRGALRESPPTETPVRVDREDPAGGRRPVHGPRDERAARNRVVRDRGRRDEGACELRECEGAVGEDLSDHGAPAVVGS